jgi:hypothetical protein
MKRLLLPLFTLLISLSAFSGDLVLIPTGSVQKTKALFGLAQLKINYYNDRIAIATATSSIPFEYTLLEKNAWSDQGTSYFLLNYDAQSKDTYPGSIRSMGRILFQADNYLVAAIPSGNAVGLYPAVHGGIIPLKNIQARLPGKPFQYKPGSMVPIADIWQLIAQVDTAQLHEYVQHLQDYGTRNAYSPEGIEAQNWIFDQFTSFGLQVELFDFTMPGGPASDDIIATLPGTKYPNEYVILGAHYDSYSYSGAAPGADDNATGTAGVLEAASIMSQYQFDRTIIFACWSGEEYGLYGSEAWATNAANLGMNILGYFNIDMAGYLLPGSPVHTDIIAPTSASELVAFYTDVCSIYLPDFPITQATLSGGDSDHTSFNNNGYMGIFPFEDVDHYSPYIHTSGDTIGPSVNNFENHGMFVKAAIASTASLADRLAYPYNLVGLAGDGVVDLTWNGVDSVQYYNIYRNSETEVFTTCTDTVFSDTAVENGTSYTYFVTAVFQNSGEESMPSNTVTIIPMPPIALPFFDDYETGAPYWTFEGSWGLEEGTYYSPSNSLTESPGGYYLPDLDISATLRTINLTGFVDARVSFWTKYAIESGYDYMFIEVSADGTEWDQLASFTGNQTNWGQKTYSLNDYLNQPNVTIRFRFTSDVYVQDEGMFIDDFEITVNGIGVQENTLHNSVLLAQNHPNPFSTTTYIDFNIENAAQVSLNLYDPSGRLVRQLINKQLDKGYYSYLLDASNLENGIYYYSLESQAGKMTKKLIIAR